MPFPKMPHHNILNHEKYQPIEIYPVEGMANCWEYWNMEIDEMIDKLGEGKNRMRYVRYYPFVI